MASLRVLFLDRHAAEGEESIVYMYPPRDTEHMHVHKLKGIVLTLRGLIEALAGQPVSQVTLGSVDGGAAENIKIVCSPAQETLVLVMMMPAAVSDFMATQLLEHICSMVFFVHGYPDVTWTRRLREEAEQGLSNALDDLFRAALAQAFGADWKTAHCMAAFPLGVPYVHLTPDVQLALSDVLNSVECVTAPSEERLLATRCFADAKRACLFHGGLLLRTHMNATEQRLVWAFCCLHNLMDRTEDYPKLMLLQDVFVPTPQTTRPGGIKPNSECSIQQRRVLLVLGLGEDLMCILLVPEGQARAEDLHKSVEVDAAVAALYHLRSNENWVRKAAASQVAQGLQKPEHEADDAPSRRRLSFVTANSQADGATSSAPPFQPLIHHLIYSEVSGMVISKHPMHKPLSSTSPALLEDFMVTIQRIRSILTGIQRNMPGSRGAGLSSADNPQISALEKTSPLGASIAAALAQVSSNSAQRLGSGDPSMFSNHFELLGLQGAQEVSLALCSMQDPNEKYYVTGRIDSRGREAYICHHIAESVSAKEAAFQLAFGVFP